MCINFTDLNQACPKDTYPLPSIDKLINSASGYPYLGFMDAYLRYNLIRMHPSDEKKIAFITEHANFCYRVMSLKLRSVGAIYQCLMNKVFEK